MPHRQFFAALPACAASVARPSSLLAVILTLGLSATVDGQQPREDSKTAIPRAVLEQLEEHLDVTFANYGDRSLPLDIFRPKIASERLPAIVSFTVEQVWFDQMMDTAVPFFDRTLKNQQ